MTTGCSCVTDSRTGNGIRAAWDLVGGHVLPHETLKEALTRECHEELGITALEVGDPVAAAATAEATLTVYAIDQWDGEPTNTAPEEHQAIGWFDAAQLAGLQLADPRLEPLLRNVLDPPDVTPGHPPPSSQRDQDRRRRNP